MIDRPTRDALLMDTAALWASRSTCDRLKVGAVVARDGRILVTGYNGTPAGLSHCDHTCTCAQYHFTVTRTPPGAGQVEVHRGGCPAGQPCTTATHAEENAITYAARHGLALEGTQLYCTHMPCPTCARMIINAGLSSVMFHYPYRDTSGLNLLVSVGIPVQQAEHVL